MATSISPSLPIPSLLTPKSLYSLQTCKSPLPLHSPLLTAIHPSKKTTFYPYLTHKISQKTSHCWRIYASSGDALPSETPIENTQQIIPTDESNGATIISVLLTIAFVSLSLLTIGVIYIAVTDFLQKRETEKFEKEQSDKMKKGSKKRKVKARAGPRGFGQKIEEDYD